jgi:general secretion pathway protein D
MNRRAFLSPCSGSASSASAFARAAFWITLFVILASSSLPLYGKSMSANTLYKHGEAAEARKDYDTAYDLYQQALKKAPNEMIYKAAMYRVQTTASGVHMTKGRKLLADGDRQGALAEFLHANEIDPSNEAAEQEIAKLRDNQSVTGHEGNTSLAMDETQQRELASMGSPVLLKPLDNEPLTLHYTQDAKVVYQAIGKAAGINVLFDPDYTAKNITVDLNNESLMDALRIVATMSNTFWRPVTDNTIFVAQNTRQKHTDLEESAVQTFYLTNAWQQSDLTDVQTAVRNILTGVKIYGVPSQNAIVIRGTPDELLLAQKLISDLDKARGEVVVDIAVMEVSTAWERTLGIQWPTTVGVALQPPCAENSNCSNSSTTTTTTTTTGTGTTDNGTTPSLYDLSHLKATDFAVTVGAATANLLLTDSNTKILQNPRLRATDAQKATLTVGEKIPVATGSYQTGAATAVVSSLVNTQFQYQDVGVKVEMTPSIHYDNDITLKIRIEVSTDANSTTISGVTEPIIAQNIVDQVIRLREGEASILGGITEKMDTVSWNGIPGLSSIPILRYLFGSKDHQIMDTELVFLVVPHIVRTQSINPMNLRTVDTGSGQNIELRHISVPGPDLSAPIRAPAQAHPTVGAVPGESATSAAGAALAQMSESADVNGETAAAAVKSSMTAGAPTVPGVKPALGAPETPSSINLMFSPPGNPISAGGTFTVPVVLTGGRNVASVPMQIQYDPEKLSLVNVTSGDLLSRDNQAVALVHRDDGPGNITINAARPPGLAGINGAGVVCALTFQAKTAGESVLSLNNGAAISNAQQRSLAQPSRVNIVVH